MFDIKWIRENKEEFDNAMTLRGIKDISDKLLELDDDRKQLVTLIQKLQQARNEKAELISRSSGNSQELQRLKKDATDIKNKLAELEEKLSNDKELNDILLNLPNVPDKSVPIGKDESANLEIRKWGTPKQFNFKVKPHFELGENLKMMDFEQTAKIAGSRFVTLKGNLARLERALASFMLDHHVNKHQFIEISPPYIVHEQAMYGAGQLPKFAEDSYSIQGKAFRLIPTSEVPLVNLVYDTILTENELPLRLVAYTPCFRSEAGSAGRDTRGMIRLHQFSKVELVSIVAQEKSEEEHEYITSVAEGILKALELPYRLVSLCTGDLGFTSRKTYDLEVWLPGQNTYREISSCSNCGEFQARRLKARYRPKDGKERKYVHTLNGSALAVGRTLVAVLENYQNEDGSITIPKVLQPYMGGITTIEV